jgi:hypothetical protein
MRFILLVLMTIPPITGVALPDVLLPLPRGVTGMPRSEQYLSTSDTSSALAGHTTASALPSTSPIALALETARSQPLVETFSGPTMSLSALRSASSTRE